MLGLQVKFRSDGQTDRQTRVKQYALNLSIPGVKDAE